MKTFFLGANGRCLPDEVGSNVTVESGRNTILMKAVPLAWVKRALFHVETLMQHQLLDTPAQTEIFSIKKQYRQGRPVHSV